MSFCYFFRFTLYMYFDYRMWHIWFWYYEHFKVYFLAEIYKCSMYLNILSSSNTGYPSGKLLISLFISSISFLLFAWSRVSMRIKWAYICVCVCVCLCVVTSSIIYIYIYLYYITYKRFYIQNYITHIYIYIYIYKKWGLTHGWDL